MPHPAPSPASRPVWTITAAAQLATPGQDRPTDPPAGPSADAPSIHDPSAHGPSAHGPSAHGPSVCGDDDGAGLFGPGSVTWRVHGDPLWPVAGLRALLLQSLHPDVAAGFAQRSTYRTGPWQRLLRTADFVNLVTFAPTLQVNHAAAYVRAAHANGTWTDPVTGTQRRVDEPDLLLWVHCCLVDSMLRVTTRGGLRLSRPDADRYVAEQVRSAELLGVPTDLPPRSVAELESYFAGVRPRLQLTDEAAASVAVVGKPPIPSLLERLTPARVGWSGLVSLAVHCLPGHAHDAVRPLLCRPGAPGTATTPRPGPGPRPGRGAQQGGTLPGALPGALPGSGCPSGALVTSALRAFRTAALVSGPFAPTLRRSVHERRARARLKPGAPPATIPSR